MDKRNFYRYGARVGRSNFSFIELILAHLFNPIKEYGSYSYLLKTKEKARINVVFLCQSFYE